MTVNPEEVKDVENGEAEPDPSDESEEPEEEPPVAKCQTRYEIICEQFNILSSKSQISRQKQTVLQRIDYFLAFREQVDLFILGKLNGNSEGFLRFKEIMEKKLEGRKERIGADRYRQLAIRIRRNPYEAEMYLAKVCCTKLAENLLALVKNNDLSYRDYNEERRLLKLINDGLRKMVQM